MPQRWRRIRQSFVFVGVASVALTSLAVYTVVEQSNTARLTSDAEMRRSTAQLVDVLAKIVAASPEMMKPAELDEIISHVSLTGGDIDRISVADANQIVIADYDRARLGRRTDYPTARRAFATGQTEIERHAEGGVFDRRASDAHLEISAPLIRPGRRGAEAHHLGVVTVEASRRHGVGAQDYRVVAMVGATIVIGMLFSTTLFLSLRRLMRLVAVDLTAARDRAEAANRAKSEFLANMSHEIRTPMNGVLGMAELLSGTRLASNQRMFVDTILASGHALLDVINHVLDFSKIESQQLELNPHPFKLSDIANQPAQLMAQMAEEKGLELLVHAPPGLPSHVTGDFGRIRQIVINLVANAIKFTEAGQVVVDLSASHGAEGRLRLRVEVRDTGVGIPADQLQDVFDKFRQVDNTSTRKHEGTGLGLSISKGLVDLMGGAIGVESTPGVGSAFWFEIELPLAEAPAPPRHAPASTAGRSILVIDDNETNRVILHELVKSWRFRDTSVASGREGLQRMRTAQDSGEPFDLVILDHHMPGMDGAGVLSAIRAAPELAKTPVILLSSVGETGIGAARTWKASADAVLAKPASASDLLDAIVTVLGEADAAAEVRRRETGGSATPDRASATAGKAPPPASTGVRVLVAEDNEVNAFVAQQVLEGLGLTCERAAHGGEAVEAFRDDPPALVLMDISMPVMNGYDATRRIREIEAQRGLTATPIIGLTAHALAGDRDKCLEAGMSDYIAKPFPVETLKQMISSWLDAGEGGRESGGDPVVAA